MPGSTRSDSSSLSPPVELRVRCGQQFGLAAARDLGMLDPGDFDPVAPREARSQSRVCGRQMSSGQLRHLAREWAGLLLDIDYSQTTLPLRLPLQAIPEPLIDDLQTLHRGVGGRRPAVEPIEHKQ